jgi:hypothetical protein
MGQRMVAFRCRLSSAYRHADGDTSRELLAFLALYSSLDVLGGFTSPDLLALLLAVLVVVFGLPAVVFGLLTFFRYCNLLIDLRDTIRRQLDTLAEQRRLKRHGLLPS